MTCADIERDLSLYLDGELMHAEIAAMEAHLSKCPVCRQSLEETRSLVRGLSLLSRPAAPENLSASIKNALVIERAASASLPSSSVSGRFTRWLQPHLMPYAVGAFYSILLFVAVFGALKHQLTTLRYLAETEEAERVMWIEDLAPLTPANYAAARYPYAVESPSLNPSGALARMASSASTGNPNDDDMVVVADIDRNGRASLAAVVEPPRNPQALDELKRAFRKDAAFVPAAYDNRPPSVRVVFFLQKMNVQERIY